MGRLFRNDKLEVLFFVGLVLITLTLKGNNDQRVGMISTAIGKYVEETSSVAIAFAPTDSIDASSVYSLPMSHNKGFLDFETVQNSSILAYNSVINGFTGDFIENNNEVAIYTVQEGDTLSFIASDYGVNVDTVIWANNLKNVDAIKPGMELKIPPINGIVHKIKKGDTVASIAKKYAADKEKIIAFNDLGEDGELETGSELIVPDGKPPVTAVQPTARDIQTGTARRFANLPVLDGYFGLPAASGFNWGRIHGRNGVDLANSCGTPIAAAADGTVVLAKASGYNGGFGKFIKIVHPNGTETLYAHARKLLASAGQFVTRGQQIAEMGSTGRSTGCHVHFEVHGAKNPLSKR